MRKADPTGGGVKGSGTHSLPHLGSPASLAIPPHVHDCPPRPRPGKETWRLRHVVSWSHFKLKCYLPNIHTTLTPGSSSPAQNYLKDTNTFIYRSMMGWVEVLALFMVHLGSIPALQKVPQLPLRCDP